MSDERVKKYLDVAAEEMDASVLFLDEALAHIRAGKANTRILDGVRVEYYGGLVPLANVATVTTPDAKTIQVQPWEKGLIPIAPKHGEISGNLPITERSGPAAADDILTFVEQKFYM